MSRTQLLAALAARTDELDDEALALLVRVADGLAARKFGLQQAVWEVIVRPAP